MQIEWWSRHVLMWIESHIGSIGSIKIAEWHDKKYEFYILYHFKSIEIFNLF